MGHGPRFEIFYQRCIAIGFFWETRMGYPLTISLTLPFCGIQVAIGKRED